MILLVDCCADPFDCSVGPVQRSHPFNCQLYIDCTNGRLSVQSCIADSFFDPYAQTCAPAGGVIERCERGPVTTPVVAVVTAGTAAGDSSVEAATTLSASTVYLSTEYGELGHILCVFITICIPV